ncbi:hypothetical protein [Uliginosibacterium sp. 31-12]|uniref:hypothetical protein n=1 Tax=Uliginosibacterium sp. 31-12 TaxID=3062781 RepID=UPI0026E1A58E|nr:hypothetical protein [Uliginosibacterium sp. 31-12]MDO6386622.1 hypothetical protein [Uliginosibacterium sp. 31-12]
MLDHGDALVSTRARWLLIGAVLTLWALVGVWVLLRQSPETVPVVAAQPELSAAALDDMDGFIAALAKLPQPVEEAQLSEYIAVFQARQDVLHPLIPIKGCDCVDLSAQHKQLSLRDNGPSYELQIKRVEEAHTERVGIDGGVDIHRSVLPEKPSLRVLADLRGPVYVFRNPGLLLAVSARDSCLGQLPSGELSVHDLPGGRSIFSTRLPDGVLRGGEPDTVAPEALRFTAHREEGFDDGKEHHCDVGDWVRKLDSVYEVACNIAHATMCFARNLENGLPVHRRFRLTPPDVRMPPHSSTKLL